MDDKGQLPPERRPLKERFRLDIALAIFGIVLSVVLSIVALESVNKIISGLLAVTVLENLFGIYFIYQQSRRIAGLEETRLQLTNEAGVYKVKIDNLEMELKQAYNNISLIGDQLKEVHATHEKSLESRVKIIHSNYSNVARRFHSLSLTISQFEKSVFDYLWYLSSASIEPDNAKKFLLSLDSRMKSALSAICNTASYVISARKAGDSTIRTCPSNIKLLKGAGVDICYFPYVCSAESSGFPEREDFDDQVRSCPVLVSAHRVYSQIVKANTDDHFVCNDLTLLLGKMQEDRLHGAEHERPKAEELKFYKSFLTVPIMGEMEMSTSPLPLGRNHMKLRNVHVIGFFCIDCMEPSFFDIEYDLRIMKQLSSYIFNCFRAFDLAHEIHNQMGIEKHNSTMLVRMISNQTRRK